MSARCIRKREYICVPRCNSTQTIMWEGAINTLMRLRRQGLLPPWPIRKLMRTELFEGSSRQLHSASSVASPSIVIESGRLLEGKTSTSGCLTVVRAIHRRKAGHARWHEDSPLLSLEEVQLQV